MSSPVSLSVVTAILLVTVVTTACNAGNANAAHVQIDKNSLAYALSEAALARTTVRVRYDGAYKSINYPGGDVAKNRGVCTDVVIRAYRALGVDLQQLVHEDMTKAFNDYPDNWGLKRPDPNIDHRRVPNLERFFTRHRAALEVHRNADYRPGDVVSWRLPHGAPHIGIVHSRLSHDGKRPLVVHNIGLGPVIDDSLFRYRITGHFRYFGALAAPGNENFNVN